MIVCHCNVLTAEQICATFEVGRPNMPRSPAQVQRCLGCAPDCGRCLVTIRKMLADAKLACAVGCATCPGAERQSPANDAVEIFVFAAE
jgi:bacterioferritin-associated ferredoxin